MVFRVVAKYHPSLARAPAAALRCGMVLPSHISLQYFPISGRAQPLRNALRDAGVLFMDMQIPLPNWPNLRDDPAIGGPYKALPTLQWGEAQLAEALPIAAFLSGEMGHDHALPSVEVARRAGIISCCYLEIMQPAGMLIWADVFVPGATPEGLLPVFAGRMLAKLDALEVGAPEEGFIGEARPVMADFYLEDAYCIMAHLLGPDAHEGLARRLPRMAALAGRVQRREALREPDAARPAAFTARPNEAEVVARLHTVGPGVLG